MARASFWLSLVMEVRDRQDNWNPRLSPTFILAISSSIPPQHSLNKWANVRPNSPGIVKWTAMGKAAWGSRLPVPYTSRRPESQSPLSIRHLHNLEWCAWLLSPRLSLLEELHELVGNAGELHPCVEDGCASFPFNMPASGAPRSHPA